MNVIRSITPQRAWLGKVECRECPISGSAPFCVLDAVDISELDQSIEHLAMKPHTLLYQTGARRQRLFLLREGAIKLAHYLGDGTQRIVRLVGSGDLIGLEALVGQPYQQDAIALQASNVCVLPVALVDHLSRTQPSLRNELMRQWQEALNQADYWLSHYSTGTARQRVARLLLSLAMPDFRGVVHLFGREDIGAMLGLSTETVSRVIAGLRRYGILREVKSNVFQVNECMLHEIADGE